MNEGVAKQKPAKPSARRVPSDPSYIVQCYESDESLIDSLAHTLIESLNAGEACIIVATASHHKQLNKATKARGFDVAAVKKKGLYTPLDADTLLATFMVDGMPDAKKFNAAVGKVLDAAAHTGVPVRAFGEMVALLWQRGEHAAAQELERLWSRLAANHNYVVHVAYPIREASDVGSVATINDGSTRILGTHFRHMVYMPKQAHTLEQEVARRERAEQALQIAEADRKQLQEISAIKDEYLSIASHQLRTPATIVKQYLALVLDGPESSLSPGQREKLRLAFESNERQLKIINDLLMAASVEAGTLRLSRQPCDVGQLIHDVAAEQTAEIARRSQTLEIVLPPLPKVQVDPRYIRMVLENLISNASKYSPPQTPITVSAGQMEGGVFIAVADKGIGISEKDQERLYKKFSRIDGSFAHSVEGTGLGLYWVKKIIELHSGTLELQSRVGHGSTFTITLPL